jgi:hypothetical protein
MLLIFLRPRSPILHWTRIRNYFSEPLVQWIMQLALAMRVVLVTTLFITPRFGGIEGLTTREGGVNLK